MCIYVYIYIHMSQGAGTHTHTPMVWCPPPAPQTSYLHIICTLFAAFLRHSLPLGRYIQQFESTTSHVNVICNI